MKKYLAVLALGMATVSSHAASAAPVIGAPIIVSKTGNVTATFVGSDAGLTSELGLVGGPAAIFNNMTTPVGTTFDLGTFTAGTVLTFYIAVSSGSTFFTGPGTGNPDLIPHAAVDAMGGATIVGFEDLLGGGDLDYNDLTFSFTNTGVPEPTTWALMIAGFGLVGGAFRRHNARQVRVSYS